MAMLFFFFRNRIVEFAKSFNRVTMLKGIVMWVVYITPFALAFALLRLTANFTAEFTFIFGWMSVSYMIGGVFHVLVHKERVDHFKQWVIE
jgi:predicted phage tail protein